jgi:2-keto-3-deoxy-L-rhamnonate aldolase RhmA
MIESAREHGKVIGMWAPDAEHVHRWSSKGVTFFETASEVGFIAEGSRTFIRSFRVGARAVR